MKMYGSLALLIAGAIGSAYYQSQTGMILTATAGFIWYCYLCVKK